MNHSVHLTDKLESVSRILPDARYFLDYIASESDVSVNLTYNGCDFFVPAEKSGTVGVIHPRVFAADFYSTAEVELTSIDYSRILIHVEEIFRKKGLTEIQFKALPMYISESQEKWFFEYLSYETKTSVIKLDEYAPSLRRRRNIQKGSKFSFNRRVMDTSIVSKGWGDMLQFLDSRNLKGLNIERILFLVSVFPEHFSIATVVDGNNEIAALALVNQIGNCLWIPNYFSKLNFSGAIDFLLDSLIKDSIKLGLSHVDLGISTDPNTNLELSGILQFKSEFSANQEVIRRFYKSLN